MYLLITVISRNPSGLAGYYEKYIKQLNTTLDNVKKIDRKKDPECRKKIR